jgi:hypothetical protein
MGGRRQFARRLVEADVTVAANAEQLESDPTRPLDRGLVTIALGLEVVGRAVESVKALAWSPTCSIRCSRMNR